MGRYNFRPARVHQATSRLLDTARMRSEPAWYDTVGGIPPSQILVRTQPVQHSEPSAKKQRRKPSKLFRPQRIHYEEDIMRKQFFMDHPWELARPRVVLEDTGKDYEQHDWSSIKQQTRTLDGESVIQRQLWLMQNDAGMTRAMAYDQARKEFYAQRMRDETEARVAKEEALATSAYFGKSMVEIGAQLEDATYEGWRKTALETVEQLEQKRAAAITSFGPEAEAETPLHSPSASSSTSETLSTA